jgi:pimeloyl-ACP methyl ester carboxylesterase
MQETSARDKYVKVGSINTRYWQAGDKGSAVVLIHGFPSSLECWEKNIDVLAQQHCVYALDWLGCGRTDKLPPVNDMFTVVDFIIGFMDTLHIDKASLIGNSMGGGIALGVIIQNSHRVEKLVLVNSAGLGPDVSIFFRITSIPLLGKLLTGKPTHQSIKKMADSIFYDSSLATPDMVNMYYEMYQLPGTQEASMSISRASCTFLGQRAKYWKRIRQALGTINTPTIIFWGKQDRVIPVKHAQIAACIPGSKLYIYDKCGHAPMMERPDEFNKRVLDFLAES